MKSMQEKQTFSLCNDVTDLTKIGQPYFWIPACAGMTEVLDSRYPVYAGTGSAGMTKGSGMMIDSRLKI